MKVQKTVEVRLVKKRQPRSIDVVQYDTGIQLLFIMEDFAIPNGTTATLYVQKPSGKFVYQETGTTVIDSTVTIDLLNQALTEHGDVGYQVRLKNGNDLITTFGGIMRVEKSLVDSGAVESTTVIAAFEAKTAEQLAKIEAETNKCITLAQKQIEDKGVEVLESIPDDYTALSLAVKTKAPAIVCDASGAMVTVTDASNLPAVSVITHIEPVQEGSGEASPSNVRPFKTFDSATVDVTNANLLGGMHLAEVLREQAGATINTSAGTVRFSSSGTGNRPLIRGNVFKPNTRYTVILYGRNTGGRYPAANIAISYTDGTYDGINFTSLTDNSYVAYTSQYGKSVASIFGIIGDMETVLYYDKCGAFEGVVTADALIPAHGKRCSATLPETVYGADIDWLSGKVYKRYHRIVFDGVTTGAKIDITDPGMTTYAFVQSWNMPKPLKNGSKAYANKLPTVSTNTVIAISLPTELTGVTSTDSVSTVVSKYNAVLQSWYNAGTPLEIVYEVENPEEIQLTPQQINTLKGVNNVWSDCGSTELSYVADTKMYIDGKFAELATAIVNHV